MSRVRKCDRCGAVYAQYETGEFNAIGTVMFNIDDEEIASGAYVDLCPKCKCEFESWLNTYKNKPTVSTAPISWEDDIK